MDAAVSAFSRNGYERTTVDEIVREAGFSKGAFYVHFESKEDLFWEMLQDQISCQQDAMLKTLDPEAPIAENERRILSAIFDVERHDPLWPALFTEFAAQAGHNDKVRERLTEMFKIWHSFTMEMLKGGQRAERVRQDLDPSFAASVIMALIQGSIIQSRLAPPDTRLSDKVEPLSRLLADWLAPGEATDRS